MVEGHKINKYIEVKDFREKLRNYSPKNIICTTHTFFRINEKQREVFTCEYLTELLLEDEPKAVGLQNNEAYAVFYDFQKKRLIKLILDIKPVEITIVTFCILDTRELPRL